MQNFKPKTYPQRTDLQNKALHVYFAEVAEALSAAGYDLKTVLAKAPVDTPVTPYSIKNEVWKPILKSYLGLDSTTQHDTANIDKVYDIFNRWLGENFNIHVDWPCEESLMFKRLGYAPYKPKVKKAN